MKIQGLGACLGVSLVLNLVGFAPLMELLLSRPGGTAQAPPPTKVQVRLVAPELTRQPPPRPQPPPPRMQQPVSPARPVPRPQPVAVQPPPSVVPTMPVVPQNSIPQASRVPSARPRRNASIRSLSRPGSNGPSSADTPQNAPIEPYQGPGPGEGSDPGGPGAASPAPEPMASPEPAPEPPAEATPGPLAATQPAPQPPPPSQGPEPGQGVIPDKSAMPKSNPPNANSRQILRKLGGKSFIRLLIKVYPDGHIEPEVLVSSGHTELDQAVLRDLREWRWEPAEVAGKPVLSEKPIRLKLEAD